MTHLTKTISYDTRARIFGILAIISVACVVVYFFAINMTVRNTVARQRLETDVSNVSAQLGELEFTYIALKNDVSLDKAYTLGFQNVATTQYITRGEARSLSMNVSANTSGIVNR